MPHRSHLTRGSDRIAGGQLRHQRPPPLNRRRCSREGHMLKDIGPKGRARPQRQRSQPGGRGKQRTCQGRSRQQLRVPR
eukprot:438426-Pyramimonas_sp.AAC.1